MARKVAVPCDTVIDMSSLYNWGLKVSDYKELFFLTGQVDGDPDGSCRHPNDPVGQTRGIFESLIGMLQKEGWSVHDIVRADMTLTKDIDMDAHRDAIYQVWADVFKDADPKPAAGTFRVVDRLARPGFFVEIEFLAAR
ncbi:MAG: RidA family protein [Dehalococcoidia bacterium]